MDWRCRWVVAVGLAAATLPACRREPVAPVPGFVLDARELPKTVAPAPDLLAPAPAPIPVAAPPTTAVRAGADVEYTTVEISGEIELPPGSQPKERLMVYIATRDCLNDASPLLRRLPVTDNRTFFAAVMAPQGSTLSICAAAEPAPGKPAHLYGRFGAPLQLLKAADQTFRDLKIKLSEDSPRSFPSKISR